MPASKSPRKRYTGPKYDRRAPTNEISHLRALTAIDRGTQGKFTAIDMNALIDCSNRLYALIQTDTYRNTPETNLFQVNFCAMLKAIKSRKITSGGYAFNEGELEYLAAGVNMMHDYTRDVPMARQQRLERMNQDWSRTHPGQL